MRADETRIRRPDRRVGADALAALVCVDGEPAARGLRVPLDGEIVIGRDAGCAVALASPDVSRRHARVVPDPAGHAVEDLGSTNGTLVNGASVRRAPLRPGDRIDVGGVVFKYVAAGDPEAREWERLRDEALRDALTGLPNRRAFDDALAREVARAERDGTALAALVLDVDRFKAVNDAHGHAAGDAVLRAVAARARSVLRSDELLARIGGEELGALLPGAGLEAARDVAERVRLAIRGGPVDAGGVAITVTASIGAAARAPGETGAALVSRADAHLYEAKRGGRDRVAP